MKGTRIVYALVNKLANIHRKVWLLILHVKKRMNKKKLHRNKNTCHEKTSNTTNAKEQLNSYVHLSFTVYATRVDWLPNFCQPKELRHFGQIIKCSCLLNVNIWSLSFILFEALGYWLDKMCNDRGCYFRRNTIWLNSNHFRSFEISKEDAYVSDWSLSAIKN